jgi:hypothetical protein
MRRLGVAFVLLLLVSSGLVAAGASTNALAIFTKTRTVAANTFTTASSFPASNSVLAADSWSTGLTHTTGSGSNRLLTFVVGYENATDVGVSTVTYGTRTMTKALGQVAGTGPFDRVEIWYLNEAGIVLASSTTFAVTWGGTAPADPMYAAIGYKNVDQTTPIATTNSATTNLSTPNPITAAVTVGGGAVAVSGVINGNTGSYTWNNSFVEGTDQTHGATTTMSSADKLASTTGTQTASATHSGSARQAIVVAVINHDTVETADTWTTGLTHTTGSGTNRLLIFMVSYENASDVGVTAVTYGTRPMTRALGAVAGTTTVDRVELWYLTESGIANATSTTFAVSWGGTAPSSPMYAAGAYKRVNQATPIASSNSATTNASTPNPITAAVTVLQGDLVAGAVINGNTGSYTWNNSFAEHTDQTSGATTTASSADKVAAADGTETASATHSGSARQAIVAAVISPD